MHDDRNIDLIGFLLISILFNPFYKKKYFKIINCQSVQIVQNRSELDTNMTKGEILYISLQFRIIFQMTDF